MLPMNQKKRFMNIGMGKYACVLSIYELAKYLRYSWLCFCRPNTNLRFFPPFGFVQQKSYFQKIIYIFLSYTQFRNINLFSNETKINCSLFPKKFSQKLLAISEKNLKKNMFVKNSNGKTPNGMEKSKG